MLGIYSSQQLTALRVVAILLMVPIHTPGWQIGIATIDNTVLGAARASSVVMALISAGFLLRGGGPILPAQLGHRVKTLLLPALFWIAVPHLLLTGAVPLALPQEVLGLQWPSVNYPVHYLTDLFLGCAWLYAIDLIHRRSRGLALAAALLSAGLCIAIGLGENYEAYNSGNILPRSDILVFMLVAYFLFRSGAMLGLFARLKALPLAPTLVGLAVALAVCANLTLAPLPDALRLICLFATKLIGAGLLLRLFFAVPTAWLERLPLVSMRLSFCIFVLHAPIYGLARAQFGDLRLAFAVFVPALALACFALMRLPLGPLAWILPARR